MWLLLSLCLLPSLNLRVSLDRKGELELRDRVLMELLRRFSTCKIDDSMMSVYSWAIKLSKIPRIKLLLQPKGDESKDVGKYIKRICEELSIPPNSIRFTINVLYNSNGIKYEKVKFAMGTRFTTLISQYVIFDAP